MLRPWQQATTSAKPWSCKGEASRTTFAQLMAVLGCLDDLRLKKL